LNLSSAIGTVMAQASWSLEQTLLRTPNQRQYFASLDELTQELLGESLPVAALFDWLRGEPWDQEPSACLDAADPEIHGFSQLGWTIDTSRLAQGWITAYRHKAPTVTVKAHVDALASR
jgi:outer membrane lipoprotein LolB